MIRSTTPPDHQSRGLRAVSGCFAMRAFVLALVAVFIVSGIAAGTSTVSAGKKFNSVVAGSSWSKHVSPLVKRF